MRWTIALSLMMVACVPAYHVPQFVPYTESNYYEPGVTLEAPIGATLVLLAEGVKRDGVSTSRFERRLIYGGRAGSVIKLVYREISNDMARPAFNQELQYDLSESDVIAYQSIRLKVVSATNQMIVVDQLPPATTAGPQTTTKDGKPVVIMPPQRQGTRKLGESCDRDAECEPNVCLRGTCQR